MTGDLAARRRALRGSALEATRPLQRGTRPDGLLAAIALLVAVATPLVAADHVVLQLRFDHQFQFAGFYAAQWEGYYEAEGLEVEIRPGVRADGTLVSVPAELVAGRADFGIAAADALVEWSRGEGPTLLASVFQHSGVEVFSRPEVDLARPADLTRLRVQAGNSPLLDLELLAMLHAEGIDAGDVQLLPVAAPFTVQRHFERLFSGEVDATLAYSIAILWEARERGLELGRLRPSAYGVDFYGDAIFSRPGLAERQPGLVERFVRASLLGWRYALDHSEELVQGIASRLPRTLPVSDLVAYNRFVAERVSELTLYPVVELGHVNPERWARMYAEIVRAGLADRPLEVEKFFFHPAEIASREKERKQRALTAALVGVVLLLLVWLAWNAMRRRRERRRADRELRESARTLRSIADNLPNLYLSVIEKDLTVGLTGGQEFERRGLDPGDFVGRSVTEVYAPYDENARRKVLEAYRRTFEGEPQSFELAIEGQEQLYRTTPLPDAGGSIQRILAVVENVTERKRAQRELEAMNARYVRQEAALSQLTRRSAMQQGGVGGVLRDVTDMVAETLQVQRVGVWRHNATHTALVCLDLFDRESGKHERGAELQAVDYPAYFRAMDEAEFIAAHDAGSDPRTAELTRTYFEPRGIGAVLDTPLHLHGAVAGTLCCEHVGPPRHWAPDEQSFAVAVANLVSVLLAHEESQILSEQLRQSQKMEAIGQLAGGVAHDFNNILTTIMMQADLAGLGEEVPREARELLQEIKVAAERAANLTAQLLAFSRRQVIQPREMDLNQIVHSLGRMVQRIVGEDVRLSLALSKEPVMARVDPGMIDQVLLNLVVNSRDAMPEGGRLEIATGERQVSGPETHGIQDASPGRYVWIRVTDTGSGIAPEQLSRIFEPFFTTKEPGKGTGLGLATVFGIVKQHGGFLQVQSRLGEGTSLELALPAAEGKVEIERVEPEAEGGLGGGETLLVVEDEPAVRRLTRIVLEARGYRVIEAASGAEALALWRDLTSPVDLLLTDLVMPEGVGGRELAARLRSERPDLPVVFTSGYSGDIAGRELELHEGQNFLQKPFPPRRLLEVVRRSLDRTSGAGAG